MSNANARRSSRSPDCVNAIASINSVKSTRRKKYLRNKIVRNYILVPLLSRSNVAKAYLQKSFALPPG
jgi:hypothetical protein